MKLSYCSYPLQLQHTCTVATCSRTTTPAVIVRIDHDGITGFGEASMPPYLGESTESACRFLECAARILPAAVVPTVEALTAIDALAPGHCAAKAAIDIALHDWMGHALHRPLHALWGLDTSRIPLTTYTIGIDTPAVMQQKVREVEGRFGRLKVKVGLPSDRTLIRALREVTDLPLTVDANQGWTDRSEALDKILWLASEGVILIEQPLPKERLDDLAWLTERSPLPIIADESVQRLADLPRLRGAVSGINIKLMKCTGLAEARRMIAEARRLDLQVMIGCMTETSCAVSAAAQLAPLADYADLDGHLLIANDPFRGATLEAGRILPTSLDGIGVTPLFASPLPAPAVSGQAETEADSSQS